ncbi:NUDIX domain-containing protein [Candidatus Dojkabacteria bacterium]|uniref:NUDIX domain-containing protein n=1 Tax=Candidatus Dojkabacteria bacterium TaxID=2099670 RepID=A0A955ICL0_9BACT|nr:NUDIX domain-containing protein [Candidatus Dojkabacteria bacterium]
MSKFDNQILAVKASKIARTLDSALLGKGFAKFGSTGKYDEIVEQATTGRRGDLEENPEFKQIIPYLVLQDDQGRILYYTRAVGTGEQRLHHKLSIGVGGHVEIEDIDDAEETIMHALKREVREEIGEGIEISEPEALGIIYRDDTPVDQVHIGVLFLAQITSGNIDPDPEAIAEAKLVSPEEFGAMMTSGNYDPETWTKIAWEYLQQN